MDRFDAGLELVLDGIAAAGIERAAEPRDS
jgi:hypothetical protein